MTIRFCDEDQNESIIEDLPRVSESRLRTRYYEIFVVRQL